MQFYLAFKEEWFGYDSLSYSRSGRFLEGRVQSCSEPKSRQKLLSMDDSNEIWKNVAEKLRKDRKVLKWKSV